MSGGRHQQAGCAHPESGAVMAVGRGSSRRGCLGKRYGDGGCVGMGPVPHFVRRGARRLLTTFTRAGHARARRPPQMGGAAMGSSGRAAATRFPAGGPSTEPPSVAVHYRLWPLPSLPSRCARPRCRPPLPPVGAHTKWGSPPAVWWTTRASTDSWTPPGRVPSGATRRAPTRDPPRWRGSAPMPMRGVPTANGEGSRRCCMSRPSP